LGPSIANGYQLMPLCLLADITILDVPDRFNCFLCVKLQGEVQEPARESHGF
jgi:hypothetical protein